MKETEVQETKATDTSDPFKAARDEVASLYRESIAEKDRTLFAQRQEIERLKNPPAPEKEIKRPDKPFFEAPDEHMDAMEERITSRLMSALDRTVKPLNDGMMDFKKDRTLAEIKRGVMGSQLAPLYKAVEAQVDSIIMSMDPSIVNPNTVTMAIYAEYGKYAAGGGTISTKDESTKRPANGVITSDNAPAPVRSSNKTPEQIFIADFVKNMTESDRKIARMHRMTAEQAAKMAWEDSNGNFTDVRDIEATLDSFKPKEK